jgi:hypothetical protein
MGPVSEAYGKSHHILGQNAKTDAQRRLIDSNLSSTNSEPGCQSVETDKSEVGVCHHLYYATDRLCRNRYAMEIGDYLNYSAQHFSSFLLFINR